MASEINNTFSTNNIQEERNDHNLIATSLKISPSTLQPSNNNNNNNNHYHQQQQQQLYHPIKNTQNTMTPSNYAMPGEQSIPHAPNGYASYPTQMVSSPSNCTNQWQGQSLQYGILNQMPSPSISSNNSLSPLASINTPGQTLMQFPDSPPLLDASQMLMSPSRFRKRRHLSPLISGYVDHPMQSPEQQVSSTGNVPAMQFLRRISMPKIPVSPSMSSHSHTSSKERSGNLILPCFFDQENNLRVHGQQSYEQGPVTGYWEQSRKTVKAFLEEAALVDEENITIIEIKQLLRRYSINATGKKTILMDRIRRLEAHLKADLERQKQAMVTQAAQALTFANAKLGQQNDQECISPDSTIPTSS